MSEELEAFIEVKVDIRHKKYRKAFASIDRLVDKQPHFYAKEAVPLLLLQVGLVGKLLIKNVFKRQPYEFGFIRTLMWRMLRNLAVLEQLLLEYSKPEISVQVLLKQDTGGQGIDQEVAFLLEKITVQTESTKFNSHIHGYMEMFLFGCLSLCLSFKQYSRWRESFRCIQLAYDLSVSLKDIKNCRVLQRIVEVKLQYAAFLNELKEHQRALQVTDEVLLHVVDLFCLKYSYREIRNRNRHYKHEKLWKQVMVSLCLNLDSWMLVGNYNRVYETMGFLEWVLQQSNIDSYAFKKCVHILTEAPSKQIEKYFEQAEELKCFCKLYFEQLCKSTRKETQPSLVNFFSELMYTRYKQQRLDRKVIALYQPNDKQKLQKHQQYRRNKHSCNVVSNQLEQDECMTAMEEDLFQGVRNHDVFRESYKSNTKIAVSSHQNPVNFLHELEQPRARHTPSQHSVVSATVWQDGDITRADEIFFRRYVNQRSGLVISQKRQHPPLRDDRDKKHFGFVKKQFKMRNKENLEDRSSSFLNLTEEKRRIKQEGEFIFSLEQRPPNPSQDNYVKKDEHGLEVPLTGIKLFVEIILQNRAVLALNKLYEKHEQVKKKRQSEFKLKKKNEEKERLRQLYRLEENEETFLRMSNFSSKRRAKVYRQSPLSEKVRQHVSPNNRTQQLASLTKQIAHENQKSQLIIKKFSQKIQQQLREDCHNPPRKLRRGCMLDERFGNLRQSIARQRLGGTAQARNIQ